MRVVGVFSWYFLANVRDNRHKTMAVGVLEQPECQPVGVRCIVPLAIIQDVLQFTNVITSLSVYMFTQMHGGDM